MGGTLANILDFVSSHDLDARDIVDKLLHLSLRNKSLTRTRPIRNTHDRQIPHCLRDPRKRRIHRLGQHFLPIKLVFDLPRTRPLEGVGDSVSDTVMLLRLEGRDGCFVRDGVGGAVVQGGVGGAAICIDDGEDSEHVEAVGQHCGPGDKVVYFVGNIGQFDGFGVSLEFVAELELDGDGA